MVQTVYNPRVCPLSVNLDVLKYNKIGNKGLGMSYTMNIILDCRG